MIILDNTAVDNLSYFWSELQYESLNRTRMNYSVVFLFKTFCFLAGSSRVVEEEGRKVCLYYLLSSLGMIVTTTSTCASYDSRVCSMGDVLFLAKFLGLILIIKYDWFNWCYFNLTFVPKSKYLWTLRASSFSIIKNNEHVPLFFLTGMVAIRSLIKVIY